MEWISSHLLLIAIVFALVVFAHWRLPKNDPFRGPCIAIEVAACILLVLGIFNVVVSPPGGEDTVVQKKRKPRPIPPLLSQLEPLRQSWNSEDDADWPVAELLASMSEASYLAPVDAEEKYLKLGFKRFMPVVDGSMLGYFLAVDDVAVIVFRGTDNDVDWIPNLNPASTTTSHGLMHRGFYTAYHSLKPQIVKLLDQDRPKHLWITGHSLGGALALVCTWDLIENEKQNCDGLITFGQPMVFAGRFGTYIDNLLLGRYAHYVNGQDFVAKIPPRYTHCGSLVWFVGDEIKRSKPKQVGYGASKAKTQPDVGVEITPLSDRQFEQFKADLRNKSMQTNRPPDDKTYSAAAIPLIDDHAMALYLDRIRSVTAKPLSKAKP